MLSSCSRHPPIIGAAWFSLRIYRAYFPDVMIVQECLKDPIDWSWRLLLFRYSHVDRTPPDGAGPTRILAAPDPTPQLSSPAILTPDNKVRSFWQNFLVPTQWRVPVINALSSGAMSHASRAEVASRGASSRISLRVPSVRGSIESVGLIIVKEDQSIVSRRNGHSRRLQPRLVNVLFLKFSCLARRLSSWTCRWVATKERLWGSHNRQTTQATHSTTE